MCRTLIAAPTVQPPPGRSCGRHYPVQSRECHHHRRRWRMSTSALDPVGPWRAQDLVVREDLSVGLRYEIVDGHLVVTPRPALSHQFACSVLMAQLHQQCPVGEWIVLGELDLPLGTDLRVPDV